jgi:two-component system, NarL family, response regulator DegU
MKTKVMIIDEQPFFRSGVRQALQSHDFEIFETDPVDDVLAAVDEKLPDIVLLGSDLASQTGLSLSAKIARNFPNTRVVILSLNPDDEETFEAIRSCAVACLPRKATTEELIATIKRASHGEYPINDAVMSRPSVAQHVLKQFQSNMSLGENIIVPLTRRETEILTYIAEGNSNKRIANILQISEQTIKNHVSAILRKLNANDRSHAVVLGIKKGLINLNDVKVTV